MIALAVLLIYLNGYSLERLIAGHRLRNFAIAAERLLLRLTAGIFVTSLISTTLALTGHFGFKTAISASFILPALFGIKKLLSNEVKGDHQALDATGIAPVLMLTVIAAAVIGSPSPDVLGGFDVGMYPSIAANVASKGEYFISDPALKAAMPEYEDLFSSRLIRNDYTGRIWKYGGFPIKDAADGIMEPEWLPGWPCFMAYISLFTGIDNMFYSVSLMSILSVLLLFALGRRLMGSRKAFMAAVFFVLIPGQIYFSRYCSAEIISQTALLSILIAFAITQKSYEDIGFGEAFFFATPCLYMLISKFEGNAMMLLIMALFIACPKRYYNSNSRKVILFLGLLWIPALMISIVASPLYMEYNFRNQIDRTVGGNLLMPFLMIALTIFLFLLIKNKKEDLYGAVFAIFTKIATVLIIACFLFAIADSYIYGIESGYELYKWDWYMTWPIILLSAIGLSAVLWKERSAEWLTAAFIYTVFFFMLSGSFQHTDLHPTAGRRLAIFIFPLAPLLAVHSVEQLSRLIRYFLTKRNLFHFKHVLFIKRRAFDLAACIVYITVIIMLVMSGLNVLNHRDSEGSLHFVAELADIIRKEHEVDEENPLIFERSAGFMFSPALDCFENIPNLTLTENRHISSELFQDYLESIFKKGRKKVIIVRDSRYPEFPASDFCASISKSIIFTNELMAYSREQYPFRVHSEEITFQIIEIAKECRNVFDDRAAYKTLWMSGYFIDELTGKMGRIVEDSAYINTDCIRDSGGCLRFLVRAASGADVLHMSKGDWYGKFYLSDEDITRIDISTEVVKSDDSFLKLFIDSEGAGETFFERNRRYENLVVPWSIENGFVWVYSMEQI